MKALCLFVLSFLLLPPFLTFSKVMLISNYPLPKNNIEQLVNEENYPKIVEILRSLDEVKDVKVEESEDRVLIRVERYPILKEVKVRGNIAILREEILSYLTLYEGIALKEIDSQALEGKLKELYRERGFFDMQAKVHITVDERGFAKIEINIKEGEVFFLGGGIYKGSSLDARFLDESLGIIRGRIAREGELSRKIFDLQELYINLGFWDSYTYYEGLQKVDMDRPFLNVLLPADPKVKRRPLRLAGALVEGMRNLFNHPISTLKAITGKGKVAYPVFSVIEGKKYDVFFEGVRFFNHEELLKISNLREKGLDPFSLEEAKDKLMKAYRSKGFFEVEINYSLDGERVFFHIRENRRYLAVLNGEQMEYDEVVLKDRLEEVLKELRKQGYTLAEGDIKQSLDRDKGIAIVNFEIEKGKKQILKSVSYLGDDREIKRIFREVNRKLPAVYDSSIIEQLNIKIDKHLKSKGYMEGSFDAVVFLEEDEDTVSYSYEYKVVEGPRYRLGLDLYYGAEITRGREISYMSVKDEFYTERILDETLYNFITSGLFAGVRMDTFIDEGKKEAHRLIKLQEDKRGFYDFGFGYNTQEGVALDLTAGLKNLLGIGIKVTADYKRAGKRETYGINLEDPFLFTRRLWIKGRILRDYQEHRSYNLDSEGLVLSLGYRITRQTSIGPILSITDNRFLGMSARLNKYGLFLLREYKDDIFNPKRIHYNNLSFIRASGDFSYTKLELSTFYLIPVGSDLNLSFKVSGGSAQGNVPIFDRYFLGGFRDLRGYSFEEIGQPNGGKSFVSGRLELEIPLKSPFVFVPFYDVGGVGRSSFDIKHSFGFGTGVATPVGPLRLDLAFPGERDFLKKFKLYLSVGYIY
ncbi:BamA/TamA family outer membrane protein [Thermocrinis sp.]